ncbi:tolB protein precursor, periplasmic protein involved in the tonb-independent uptake of group A colicins [hydrothermal vent metagenome]|uniref:TolB protein, periplasmic protein involved in the tonb-independent uptake of group A colicins n=1 Tax=hydrothermal vent metagenome TaxID=652676 RepID=A0A3B0UPY8_9ZZZZ
MFESDRENDPLITIPEKKRLGGCHTVFILLVVFAMLGVSASGAIWFLFLRDQPQERTPVTAVPSQDVLIDEGSEPDAPPTPTAVSPLPTIDPADAVASAVNRIVYIDEAGQIISLEPDGNDVRMVTNAQQRFRFPAWSPDGRSIAAIGTDVVGVGLFVLADDQEAQTPSPLYADDRNAPFYFFWSPDSRQVSFLASHPDGMGLHLVPADGSADSRVLTTGAPMYWDWTSDSRQILIHSGFAGAESRLELLEADGNGKGDAIAAPGYFQAPGISADGRYWAYAEEINGSSSRLVVIDRQSGMMEEQRHDGLVALTWSPTANQIAFTNGTEQNDGSFIGPLRLMDAATGEVKLINREPIVAFFWSPDGRYLAAFSVGRAGEGDINVLAGKNAAGKVSQQQNLPRLRLLIYDVTLDEGRLLFSFVPTVPFATQLLPFFDQYALSHQLWSPTSDALVLSMLQNGRNQIFVINTATGRKRFLAEGLMPFWSPK